MFVTMLTRILLGLTILSMVAVEVDAGEPTTPTSHGNGGGSAMSKAFAVSTKLSETNYMVWYAGILTVLLGITVEPYAKLMEVFETIKVQMHNTLDVIERGISAAVFKLNTVAELRANDLWKRVEKTMFNVIYWTVDEQIAGLKHSLATTMMFKGLEALKYIHDNYGPGCGTTQVGRAMDIMTETQNAGETAQEYGTRLLSINATLQEKIPRRNPQTDICSGRR